MSERDGERGVPEPDAGLMQRALARFPVAPEAPRFFEGLRERMSEHDRALARRWRRVSVALALVSVMAIAAAAVLAASSASSGPASTRVVDRTISCPVQFLQNAHALDIGASTEIDNTTLPPAMRVANLDVFTVLRHTNPKDPRSFFVPQLEFLSRKDSLKTDTPFCRGSRRHVPLRSAGLPSNGTLTPSFVGRVNVRCIAAARALIRFRVTETGGVPTRAQVAIRNDDARTSPIAYLSWAPRRLTSFLENRCVPHNGA